MTLLAFDTSCDACSVAVWRDGTVAAHCAKAMVRGQSEELVPMIERVMREAGDSFAALAGVAVTAGPGAFTGLRIGLATARAIAMAAGRPAVGVSTFEAIAIAAAREDDTRSRGLVIAIDTKRDDLYVQMFRRDASSLGFSPVGEGAVLTPNEVIERLPPGPLLLAGDGARHLSAALTGGTARAVLARATVPDAADVAAIAALRLSAGTVSQPLRPLYPRPPAVRLPSGAGASP
jgi:tRNA threonylcarbamoyladenosine biosynthesis protein TsaB